MKKKKLAYWITTAFVGVALTGSGIANIVQPPEVVSMMAKLQIPLHLLSLIGMWKLLGVAAITTDKFPKLTEWAYAGLVFDLTGAAYLHAMIGDTPGIAPPLVILSLVIASYSLKDNRRDADSKNATLQA